MNDTPLHPQPSARARDLVRGAYDLHVHTGPDLLPRSASDLELARRCREVGLAGFVIKSHYVPSAPRAALARSVVPDVHIMGSIVLNSAVGGMNTMAVEIAAREGARIVWMPTFDTYNEMFGPPSRLPLEKRPQWARLQHEMREQGVQNDPVRVVDEDGRVLPETQSVLQSIAAHDLILATGHLNRDEIFAVVEAALVVGVRQIIVTHPEYPAQSLSAEDQLALARRGAWLERCFTTPYTGKVSWEQMYANIRAVGPDHSFLSSDLGQPTNPPIEDGLALLADRLLAAGFSEEEVHMMAVTNTVRLATGKDAQ
jgi:hypothetical protein